MNLDRLVPPMKSFFFSNNIFFATLNLGRDKSAPIAVLQQAKIYPTGKLRLLQIVDCGCRNPRAATNHEPQSTRSLMFSWIAAAHGLRHCRKRRWCAAIRALLYGPTILSVFFRSCLKIVAFDNHCSFYRLNSRIVG